MIDALPYRTFKKLKDKYPAVCVLIQDCDSSVQGLHLMYKNHREFVEKKFKDKGIEVYRHAHKYSSLDGPNPEMGLVYLANDSVIVPGLEVWCLIGHNARYTNET